MPQSISAQSFMIGPLLQPVNALIGVRAPVSSGAKLENFTGVNFFSTHHPFIEWEQK